MQRINLYKKNKTTNIGKKIMTWLFALSAARIVGFNIIFMLILAGVYVCNYNVYKYKKLELDKLNSISTVEAITTEPNQLILEKTLEILKDILSNNSEGFAKYFYALEKHNISGVRLTKIEFLQGGKYIYIEANALESALVPKYLKLLGSSEEFKTRKFHVLKISNQDLSKRQNSNVFVLESKYPEKP